MSMSVRTSAHLDNRLRDAAAAETSKGFPGQNEANPSDSPLENRQDCGEECGEDRVVYSQAVTGAEANQAGGDAGS